MAQSANEESWKDEVREKLVAVFTEKSEDLCRILFFLDEEDKAYKDNAERPYAPQWKSLKATLKSDKTFKMFAQRLSDETKKAEKDQEFRSRMNKVHENMMSHCDDEFGLAEYQKLDRSRLLDLKTSANAAFGGLARAWNIMSSQSKASILEVLTVDVPVDDARLAIPVGTFAMVGLAALFLSLRACANIRRWWKGEISGKRCIKNLLDATFTVAAGMGGSCAGAALGSMLGPVGTVVGGILGGSVSAAAASYLSDLLTQKLFGLPKDEALENAYIHLGVKMTASNAEVNTAFRQLCLKTHPDKPGGNTEDFFILQNNMSIIKLARGDF